MIFYKKVFINLGAGQTLPQSANIDLPATCDHVRCVSVGGNIPGADATQLIAWEIRMSNVEGPVAFACDQILSNPIDNWMYMAPFKGGSISFDVMNGAGTRYTTQDSDAIYLLLAFSN